MTLGERIKEQRNKLGFSQEKIAEMVGTSRQAVTKWESDQSIPCMENLITLAEIFGIPLTELSSGENANTVREPIAKPVKKFYGGMFVLANLFVCILHCFWGLILNKDASAVGIVSAWILLLTSATIYFSFGLAIKSGDYTMLAGYNSKKKYNIKEMKKHLTTISVANSFMLLVYTALLLIIPFLNEDFDAWFTVIIIFSYVLSFCAVIFISNKKRKLIIED